LSSAIVNQPITVAVDATNWSSYSSGVFSNCAQSINHAVLLVGSLAGNWKIKNSWGAGWGEKGFMRIKSGNTCAICAYQSSYAK
jgi:C1A family cysteine protease